MTLKDLGGLLQAAVAGWVDDYAQSMGAALAFYTMFSIAPLLLIVISVAGLVSARQPRAAKSSASCEGMLGAAGAMAVQGLLESVRKPAENVTAAVFGVGPAADRRDVRVRRAAGCARSHLACAGRAAGSGFWSMVRARLLSFGMILGIGFLLMVSLVASAGLAALQKWWGPVFGELGERRASSKSCSSFVVVTVVFAMIYKIMPRVRIDWKDVWIGAAVTSLLFAAGKILIGVYIGSSGIASGFGAAASLVVVLLWVYYSAQIFLLGAEFTWAYAHKFGSRKGLATVDASAAPAPLKPPL